MRKQRVRLQWQLTLYVTAAVVAILIVFLLVDRYAARRGVIQAQVDLMQGELGLLRMTLRAADSAEKREAIIQEYCESMRYHGRGGHAVAVISSSGWLNQTGQALSLETLRAQPAADAVLEQGADRSWAESELGGQNVISVGRVYDIPGEGRGVLFYAEPTYATDQLLAMMFLRRTAMIGLVMLSIAVVTWVVVRRKVTAPMNALLTHEFAVSKGDLRTRDYPDPGNEISEVYDMFNLMVDRLRELHLPEVEHTPEGLSGVCEEIRGLSLKIAEKGDAMLPFGSTFSVRSRRLLNGILHAARQARSSAEGLGASLAEEADEVAVAQGSGEG